MIDDWESAQVQNPIPAPARRIPTGLAGVFVGLLVGVVASYAYFRVPVQKGGIDHDDDGQLDERWFNSAGGTPVRTEVDRDFDDKPDFVFRYDGDGRLDSADADDDFNGTFETQLNFIRGSVTYWGVDSDGDSSADLIMRLQNGVLVSTEYLIPGTGQTVRKEHFELGRVRTAEVDSDRDGRFDTLLTYSSLGEIVESTPIDEPD